MKLKEIFDQLSMGEFSQLSIGGADAGVIDETNYDRVLGHVNLALTTLFTRFNLKEQRVPLTLELGKYTYDLKNEDLIKIEKVLTDKDFELGLNMAGDEFSCHTPSLKTLQIPRCVIDQGPDLPDELKTVGLTVAYRANHPKIKTQFGFILPEMKEVELPATHLMPLLYFVASRVHNPVGMVNEFNAGNNYWMKYEAACQELEGKGIQIDRGFVNDRLTRNGWA